jgi:hypothetical protein
MCVLSFSKQSSCTPCMLLTPLSRSKKAIDTRKQCHIRGFRAFQAMTAAQPQRTIVSADGAIISDRATYYWIFTPMSRYFESSPPVCAALAWREAREAQASGLLDCQERAKHLVDLQPYLLTTKGFYSFQSTKIRLRSFRICRMNVYSRHRTYREHNEAMA